MSEFLVFKYKVVIFTNFLQCLFVYCSEFRFAETWLAEREPSTRTGSAYLHLRSGKGWSKHHRRRRWHLHWWRFSAGRRMQCVTSQHTSINFNSTLGPPVYIVMQPRRFPRAFIPSMKKSLTSFLGIATSAMRFVKTCAISSNSSPVMPCGRL